MKRTIWMLPPDVSFNTQFVGCSSIYSDVWPCHLFLVSTPETTISDLYIRLQWANVPEHIGRCSVLPDPTHRPRDSEAMPEGVFQELLALISSKSSFCPPPLEAEVLYIAAGVFPNEQGAPHIYVVESYQLLIKPGCYRCELSSYRPSWACVINFHAPFPCSILLNGDIQIVRFPLLRCLESSYNQFSHTYSYNLGPS